MVRRRYPYRTRTSASSLSRIRSAVRGSRGPLRQNRIVRQLGVDEKAVAKGHTYLTLVGDVTQVPDAAEKIVFDRFHIRQHMGTEVDTVRKREHKELLAAGDEALKGSTDLCLYGQENIPEDQREKFEALRDKRKAGRA